MRHDPGVALLCGESQLLDVLDAVHAGEARHDQAQRAAVGQWNGLAIHLPGQQRVLHGGGGHRALDHDGLGIEAIGQLLAAGAGHVDATVHDATQCIDHRAHRHAAPDHAAGRAHGPAGAAGLAREEAPAVARALQHHGHRLQAHGLELAHCHFAGIFHAANIDFPGVAVGDDGSIGCGQVVAQVQLVAGGDDAGAKGAAFGLQRVAAVHDDAVRVLPAQVGGQGLGGGGLRQRARTPAGQAGSGQGGSAACEQAATGQGCG